VLHTITPLSGFGLGLRKEHYGDFLNLDVSVDFVEVISENFIGVGGKPLQTVDQVRERHPVALHGVSMSIGTATGLNLDYLRNLKTLAQRVCPLWVSDHLCWTNINGFNSHDLLPIPYTEEALDIVCVNINTAQDVLERPMLFENPSSYLSFTDAGMPEAIMTEWEFLANMCERTGCSLLLDINNIYVSGSNHGFNPDDFLAGIPMDRVRQIHLAGHSIGTDMLIDTHDMPVCDAVWALYQRAAQRFTNVATMIERDDNIPPLDELLSELEIARTKASDGLHLKMVSPA
jgi:uncharacterized protein